MSETEITTDVPVQDLTAALAAVLPMAGTDQALPMLTWVRFETQDEHLVLIATNRYVLGTYRLDWAGPEVAANVASGKDLLAWLKKAPKLLPVQLTFTDGALEVADFDGRKATFPYGDGEFVKWQAVMPEHSPERTRFGLNPAYVARFAAATGATPAKPETAMPMQLSMGSPVKPILVEIGERFTGMVMPIRLP